MNTRAGRQESARRAHWILFITLFALCACVLRLFLLQIVQGPALAAEGLEVRTSASDITAQRGSITDDTGIVLAESVQTYHIAVNQINIRTYEHDGQIGPAAAASQLAPLLRMDPVELGGLMVGDSTYAYVKKNVDAVTYRKIRAMDIYGIEWESAFERTYPNGSTAGPVIGTINAEGVGASGLEATMDQILQGSAGREAFEIAPNGAIMPGGKHTVAEPVSGGSVRTTLRADLQHGVQEALDARVKAHNADWGAVVITDVKTGRILALADSNSTAPNSATPQPVSAVQYAFEPGSVGKVVTVATALNKGTITPTSEFTVPYSLDDLPGADGPISDLHEHPTERMTATGILAESSNTGTILIGQTVDDADRYDMMLKLGLGAPSGIELAGESSGVVRTPDQWIGRDKWVSMFGQSYSMTAVQEATMMATIGNGGVRMPPRIIDSWQLADGTVHTPDPVQPVQAMSAQSASDLLKMMESTVATDVGTGQTAKIDGYRLALKTGTADIFVDGVPATVSTVAGVLPAEAPQIAVSVVLYNPKVGVISSDSAAPLFAEVASQAVRNLAIPASQEQAELFPLRPGS